MQYVLIHTLDENLQLDEEEVAEDRSSLATWLEEVIPLGVDLHGSRLRPTTDATTVRVRNGELLVTDGPFAETKEQVAGYDVLECSTLEEAVGWASKHPTARIGAIEVRPLAEGPPVRLVTEPTGRTMRYMLLICVDRSVPLQPQEIAGIGPTTEAWVAEMDGRGIRIFGNELEAVDHARTVRAAADQVLVTDGPFAETKEQIAGFDIIDCTDLDEAIEVAAKHPVARFGAIEVRPFWPLPWT